MFIEFSAATVGECNHDTVYFSGVNYWTAGQRLDHIPWSPFVWRVISPAMHYRIVSEITYTNWDTMFNEPNGNHADAWLCVLLQGYFFYMWDDQFCYELYCSVCEINM